MKPYTKRSLILAVTLLFYPQICQAKTKPKLTKEQKRIIAIVLSAEAGGEGFQGLYLVANTIKNRALKGNISPYSVVIAPKQYYGLTAKNRLKLYAQVKKDADYLAENIMELPDKTKGALYFRRPDELMFQWCKVFTVKYKNHSFYK